MRHRLLRRLHRPDRRKNTRACQTATETVADAQRGLRALTVEWDDEHAERRSTDELLAEHRRIVESGEGAVVARADGDVESGLAASVQQIDAVYELPYLAHAPMEPNDAVCRMGEDGVLDVWAGTESPEYTRMGASDAAGIDRERVRVHVPYAGGSFGLHSSAGNDPTSEAVEVARALGWKYPVKVQSLREEEFKSGRFRAMAVHRVRAGVDADGRLTAFHQRIAAQPTSVHLPYVRDVMFTGGVDFFTTTGAADHPYTLPNFKLEASDAAAGPAIPGPAGERVHLASNLSRVGGHLRGVRVHRDAPRLPVRRAEGTEAGRRRGL